MPSKAERLHVLDELSTPDLWPDIRQREPSVGPGAPSPLPPARRLVAATVALGVATAGSLVVVRAFSGDEPNRPLTVPGAARIVFSGGSEDAQVDLFSMNPDGSDLRQLTDTPSSEEQPAPSPDGSRLAFADRQPGDPTSYVIGVMDADGANRGEIPATRLEAGNPVGDPAWSPDGSEIAFAAYGDGGGIYVAGVGGGPPRRLTTAGPPTTHVDREPEWSPNGDSIAFIRWLIGDAGEPPAYEILRVEKGGGEPTLVARLPAPSQGLPGDEIRGLSWSPDGSRLAFAAEGAIYAVDADGGEPSELVSCDSLGCDGRTDVFTNSTTWSLDGRQIAFTAWADVPSARADPPLIYIATVTGDQATVTSTGVGGLFPAWQPVRIDEESPGPSVTPSPTAVSAQVAGQVQLEGIPGSVAAADGSVWVATYDYENEQAAVVHIDAATNEVVASVPVGRFVYNLAVGAGAVWVSAGAQPSVELLRIDATTNEVTGRVQGIHGPVVVDPTGVWAIEDGPNERDAAVVRIDPETLQVQARVPVGESPFDMVAGAGSIWVAARDPTSRYNEPGDLLRIDASSGTLAATIPIESAGTWIAADDAGVWVNDWDPEDTHDAKAYFIDASTNAVSGEPGDVYNFRPFAVADGRVWFISGPHDPGLPDGGVCGLNVVSRRVDVCAEPESAPNLVLAHDPAAFDPVTHSIWLGTFDKPWITRIDVSPTP